METIHLSRYDATGATINMTIASPRRAEVRIFIITPPQFLHFPANLSCCQGDFSHGQRHDSLEHQSSCWRRRPRLRFYQGKTFLLV